MIIVHVQVHVKSDRVRDFAEAARKNASNSVKEPGCARFDVVQDTDDPTRFVLVEVYRDAQAVDSHKETAHYLAWRDTVADMMAEPRTNRKFTNVFPEDSEW
jgi:quinol monooxygenase YgiN